MGDRTFPDLLKQLHELEFDYADGEGYDFEPYSAFLSESETRDWIRAWTANAELDGAQFLVFGQDGSGGYAAIWNHRPGATLLEQPVVFLGSEGNAGVLACDFADYLWLLAGGIGPCEAIEEPDRDPAPEHLAAEFRRFATEHAGNTPRTAAEVLASARREFPTFADDIQALCRFRAR